MEYRHWRAVAEYTAKNHRAEEDQRSIVFMLNMCVLLLILAVSFHLGITLGFMDFWDELKVWRGTCLISGCIISSIIAIMVMLGTIKHECRVNLIWLGLPVAGLCVVERFLYAPAWRPWLVMGVATIGLLTPWVKFQRRRVTKKALAEPFKGEQ